MCRARLSAPDGRADNADEERRRLEQVFVDVAGDQRSGMDLPVVEIVGGGQADASGAVDGVVGDIAGFAQGVAERPAQVQEARRVSRGGHFFHECQRDRRHPAGFDFSGEQSHGPRADGSGGHQKSQINTRLADAPRDFFDRRHELFGTAH